MSARSTPLVASVVGMDGCGKSSTFRGALAALADNLPVVGLGDSVWSGGPDEALHERLDIPLSRSARLIGGFAKGLRWQRLYKNLKLVEFTERTHICQYVARHESPTVILTDGQPLVNSAVWSAALFFRRELDDDELLLRSLGYLAGESRIPLGELPYYLAHAPQLVLLNWLRLSRFRLPDLVFLLDLDPAVAMARIRARGKPLQAHETEAALGQLGASYRRVCGLYQARRGVKMTTIRVDEVSLAEAVRTVTTGVLDHVAAGRTG